MNKDVHCYTDCCSKLEKIASKRRFFGSDSALKLNKKDSKLQVSSENLLKEPKDKNKKIPFICVSSANKSHHMGINIQTTLSMIKQFPSQNSEQDNSINSSSNFSMEPKLSKNSGTSIAQQFSELQFCPARSEDRFIIQEDEIFDGGSQNPWAVKQTDKDTMHIFECGHQNSSCTCPARLMDTYYKVMIPFMKHLRRKQKSLDLTVQNPYTKAKVVQYYELLSKRMQELKLSMVAMNNEFLILTEKYNKLYEQHVRNHNNSLIPVLLQTEDELNALKSKVEEAVDVYKEAAFVNTQEQSNSSASLLANIEADQNVKPKETNTIRLAKVLRRVQILQERLKTGHILQNNDDQAE